MGDCNRCGRENDANLQCPACHERFCERHRAPAAHESAALRLDEASDAVESVEAVGESNEPADDATGADSATGDAVDATSTTVTSTGGAPVDEPAVGDEPTDTTSSPTRLYAGDVDAHAGADEDDRDDDETLPGMDFDPTVRVGRFLRIAGVFVVVLLVGAVAAGVLWPGPGGGVFGLSGDAGSATAPSPGELNVTQVERLVHERINLERRDAGVEPLTYDEELAAIGEYHSRDMAANGYTSHTSPGRETTDDRYRQFGYTCEAIGEVVQWVEYDEVDWDGDAEAGLARAIVENWMRSDLHRAYLTNGSWSRHGVGIHVTDAGQVYVTQNTCGGA